MLSSIFFCINKYKVIIVRKIPVKILSRGDVEKPIEISAQKFSQTAVEKIEKAGGKANFI